MNKISKLNYMVWILGFLELIVAVVLGVKAYPMLPSLYFWILVVMELVFVLLAFLAVKRTWSAVVMSILALILTVVMLLGTQVLGEIADLLDKVTGNTHSETIEMCIILDKEDKAEEISDLVDYHVGYLSENVSVGGQAAIEKLDAQLEGTAEYIEYEDIVSMVNDLIAGKNDAVIISKAHLTMLTDQKDYADFYDKIRVLASFMVEVEISNDDLQSNLPNQEEGSAIEDGTFLIYISGIDTKGSPNVRQNSDVNILAAVNTKTKTVQLVNTPRDFYIPLPTTKGNLDKLTHAGCYSIDCSIGALESLYEINIDYYVKVNFDGFKEIIDAMGGVDVYSKYTFSPKGSEIVFHEGINHLDGEKALLFARERKAFAAGDHQRGKNQMAVITAMIQKLSSPEVLANYADLLKAISGSFVTNLSSDEIYTLVKGELESPGAWTVQSYAASGSNGIDYCYSMPGIKTYVMIPDYETVETAKQKIQDILK